MSETPEVRAARLARDAERKRLSRRLVKVVVETPATTEGESVNPADATTERFVGETPERRRERLDRDAEAKRARRAALKLQQCPPGHPMDMESEPLDLEPSKDPTQVQVLAQKEPEFNYDELLSIAGIIGERTAE